jgi:site-specific recombinase XerC
LVDKEPTEVTAEDVLAFIQSQRAPRHEGKVVRLSDGESGLMTSTIKRRLSSVSGFYAYLVMVGDLERNPVPHGIATRRRRRRGEDRCPTKITANRSTLSAARLVRAKAA